MPSVASETNSHAPRHASARHAHRPPQANRAPPSPFDSLVDDAAAPEQSAPRDDAPVTAQADMVKTPAKTKPHGDVTIAGNAARSTESGTPIQTDPAVVETAGDKVGPVEDDGKSKKDSKAVAALVDQIPNTGDDKHADKPAPDVAPVVPIDGAPVTIDAVAVSVEAATTADPPPETKPGPVHAALPLIPPVLPPDLPPAAAPQATLATQKPKPKLADGVLPPTDGDKPIDDTPLPDVTVPETAPIDVQAAVVKSDGKEYIKALVAQSRGEPTPESRRADDTQLPAPIDSDAPGPTPQVSADGPQPLVLNAQAQSISQTSASGALPASQVAPQAALVPFSGIAVEIAGKALAGKNRFEIRLDPPELGRIEVRLDVDRDGNVTSRLVVDRAETLDLLRRDASGLERALQDAGLKTADNGLQFSLRDQSSNWQADFAGSDSASLTVDDTPPGPPDPLQYAYNRTGRAGGLDIRV